MDDGFAELLSKLESLKGDGKAKAERKALRAVGALVQAAIVEAAPVRVQTPSGTALAPGALKADIRVRVHIAADANAASDISRVTIGPGKDTAHVAQWVETGHESVHGGYSRDDGNGGRRGPGKVDGKRVDAHPFIRPAADAVEQKAIDTYTTVMTDEIKKAMHE